MAGESKAPETGPGHGGVGFNPRPRLMAGESVVADSSQPVSAGFNPRPRLMAGESAQILPVS